MRGYNWNIPFKVGYATDPCFLYNCSILGLCKIITYCPSPLSKVFLVKTEVCNNLLLHLSLCLPGKLLLCLSGKIIVLVSSKLANEMVHWIKITCCRAWPKFNSWDQLDEWRKLTHTNCTLTSTCTLVHTQLSKHSKTFLSLTLIIKWLQEGNIHVYLFILRTIKYLMATHI